MHPKQVPFYQALIIDSMPYAGIARYLGAVDWDAFFQRNFHAIIECLGGPRTYNCLAAVAHLQSGDALGRRNFHAEDGPAESPIAIPDDTKLKKYESDFGAQMVSLGSIILKDSHKLAEAAQLRAIDAEETLKKERIKWARTQERMQSDSRRAKESASKDAADSTRTDVGKEMQQTAKELEQAKEVIAGLESELSSAKARLSEIEACGGATPESLQKIKDDLAREAEDRIKHEVSEKVRPWLAKLIEAEAGEVALGRLEKLSSEVLDKARAEAQETDIILRWELNKARALPELERRLEELDAIMAAVLSPSQALHSAHASLRQQVMKCRQELNPSGPLGGVTKAMMAGIRSASDEALQGLVAAIESLILAKVVDEREGDALRRFIAGERMLRNDKRSAKASTTQRLSSSIHAGKAVDIFVDSYNFMHTVQQHFRKFARESKHSPGKDSFGPEGRAYLAKFVSRIYVHNPDARVLLFLDGFNNEERKPHKGVKFILPTIKTSGEGQADAEIVHYLAHKARSNALVVVVSNDRQMQTAANLHLSPGEFARFLEDLA
jgi:hypothetical protein